jgi:hypothetical protein
MKAHLQTEFIKYHEAIKLKNFDENADLREKRDLLVKELKEALKKAHDEKDPDIAKFEWFNQGSYAMGTGVKPVDGDFDIDVGLKFHFDKDKYGPVEVKEWVHDALSGGNRTVEWMRPCIRVQYTKDGEPTYHVDLAIYSWADYNTDGNTYLAKGFLGSSAELKVWEVSEPDKLKELIDGKYDDTDDWKQFRRTIRYMKRWKNIHFKLTGDAEPTGIAITALALRYFHYCKSYNSTENKTHYNDLQACYDFVVKVINSFNREYNSEARKYVDEISIKLPVRPWNDLLKRCPTTTRATSRRSWKPCGTR